MDAKHRQIIKENNEYLQKVDYDELVKVLRKYKLFNRYMWKDVNSISDLLQLLPSRGPEAFYKFIEILREANYHAEADLLEKPAVTVEYSDKLFYTMSSKPLGYCLIINNMKFDSFEYRHGSDVDAKSLQAFFEKADFEVKIETNLTANKMNDCLLTFADKDFSKVDSMILIIMSHGSNIDNKEVLYGTDEKYLYKEYIYNIFNNKNCVNLQSKPKVFFFIACRGKDADYGVPKSVPKESLDSTVGILATLGDMLVIHSSLPYKVTIRDHEKGTYFCQALVPILNHNYKRYDLGTMIELVNGNLEGKVSEIFRIAQAIHSENFLKKKIMLHRRS